MCEVLEISRSSFYHWKKGKSSKRAERRAILSSEIFSIYHWSHGRYGSPHKKGNRDGLLEGRAGRIITTAGDLSLEIYEELYAKSGLVQLKKGILEYCGISSIQDSFIGPVEELEESDKKKMDCPDRRVFCIGRCLEKFITCLSLVGIYLPNF